MSKEEDKELDLEAIESRYEISDSTSPGPWVYREEEYEDCGAIFDANNERICSFGDGEQYYPTAGYAPNEADLNLILHASKDIGALIAEVKRLRGELNKPKEVALPAGVMWHRNQWCEPFLSCGVCGSTYSKPEQMVEHYSKFHSKPYRR